MQPYSVGNLAADLSDVPEHLLAGEDARAPDSHPIAQGLVPHSSLVGLLRVPREGDGGIGSVAVRPID